MISQANPVGIELYTYLVATQPRLVRQISPIWRGSLLDGLSNTITPCCNNVSFSFSFFSKRVLVTAKLPVLCNIVFFFFFFFFRLLCSSYFAMSVFMFDKVYDFPQLSCLLIVQNF